MNGSLKFPLLYAIYFQVKLALRKSQEFELLTGSRSHKLCVCGNEAKTHTFHIRPLNLGHINITVKVSGT